MNHIPLLKMAVHCSNLALSLNSNLTFGTNNSDNTISMVIDWLLVVGTARIEQGRHTRVILHAQHCKVIFKQMMSMDHVQSRKNLPTCHIGLGHLPTIGPSWYTVVVTGKLTTLD